MAPRADNISVAAVKKNSGYSHGSPLILNRHDVVIPLLKVASDDELRRLAHEIRGTANALGARDIAAAAGQLESRLAGPLGVQERLAALALLESAMVAVRGRLDQL